MAHPILATGAAGGAEGSTVRRAYFTYPVTEDARALVSRSVAQQSTVHLPWGGETPSVREA